VQRSNCAAEQNVPIRPTKEDCAKDMELSENQTCAALKDALRLRAQKRGVCIKSTNYAAGTRRMHKSCH